MSKIAEIRMLFEAKIKDGIPNPPGSFDQRDLDRVKSDKYLYRVLEHCENNVQLAVEMLFNLMLWRKTNAVNEITEENVNAEYLRDGLFFPRGRDIDSCILFIMKSKKFVKGQKDMDALKKVIIYWFERLEREEDGKKMTLFFDMDGCGLSNMDVDIIMYMITLLKNYYPNFVNYIIVFELPWILSAGFKIVKGILPARAVEKLRTINKDKLKDLVAPEQALVSWGGKDDYVFKFISEGQTKSQESKLDTDYSPGEMVSLSPSKVLTFKTEKDVISAHLTIKNMEDSIISFKIRTTAPEKYSVKPSSGILTNGSSQTIHINVNSGFLINSVEKDRFLVLCIQVPKANLSQKELSELWKNSGGKADEYRLKCDCHETEKTTVTKDEPDFLNVKLSNLQDSHRIIMQNIKVLKVYQISTMILTFATALLGYFVYTSRNTHSCDAL
ncbi:motile sperm domain-containing protein 2-like [Aricia agestis]|uniref:motile sperm domain-containing protein 2-like n=1 Tax=Aricia agestis TaxID=91739 RepID=UPI001C20394C|nr:motile sperm domain-containing protein 2-like [Aricia agestis]